MGNNQLGPQQQKVQIAGEFAKNIEIGRYVFALTLAVCTDKVVGFRPALCPDKLTGLVG